jgi:hypothetical protein
MLALNGPRRTRKILDERRLEQIRDRLLDAVEQPEHVTT